MQTATVMNFEKLSGQDNYGTWAFAMEMFLIDLDLWECIDENFKTDTVEAQKKDAKARSKICLMCTSKIYPMIMNVKTARNTWLALKRAYADGGLLRRLYLLRKLFNVKLTSFNTIEEYLNDIQTTSQALVSIKAGLDDEFVGIIMLAGLTEAYNSLVMTLEHSNVKISTETVTAALLKESMRKNTTEDNSALMSKNDNTKKMVICHLCKKKGHYKWQCKEKKGNNSCTTTQVKNSKGNAGLITALSAKVGENEWVIDSGATSHMTSDRHILENKEHISSKVVTTANNDQIVSKLKGDVFAMGRTVRFEDVLMLPGLMTNLLSVSKMCSKDFVVVFDKYCCKVFKKNDVTLAGNPFLTAPLKQGLYVLDKEAAMVLTSPPDTSGTSSAYDLWHRRLGHLSRPLMNKLKGLADGLSYGAVSTEPCEGCCKGKECVKRFPKRKGKRAKELLELVHTDLAGPMEVESLGGNRYYLIFVDDYSRKIFSYLLNSKTEVFAKFKEFKSLVENQTGKKIIKLRSDNGTEYTNNEFQHFLKQCGIQHQTSVPHTPQQNGVAERTIRTITEKARCMLQDAGLDKRLWGEAIGCAVYLKNRSPTMALVDKVPEEVFTGERVHLSHLRVFGSKAQVLIKDHSRKKFDSKTVQMVMTGYALDRKAYRFINFDKDPRTVIFARDATFFETVPVEKKQGTVSNVDKSVDIFVNNDFRAEPEVSRVVGPVSASAPASPVVHIDSQGEVTSSSTMESDSGDNFYDSVDSDSPVAEDLQVPENINASEPANGAAGPADRRYPLRDRRLKRDKDMVYNFHVTDVPDPVSVQDAMERSDKRLWLEAMKDEFNSLKANNTWDLVDRPLNVNVVKSKWVFKLKVGADGSVQRHKARLVAKGYSQRPGEDYFETYAPVVKLSSIRLLLALAAEKNLSVHHIDVTTAFLYGDLQEEIYVEQPEFFVQAGEERKVCKLKKALYGLKQAAKCWNDKIHAFIMKIGFTRSKHDQCVYVKKDGHLFMALTLYVDDIHIFTNCESEAEKVKELIRKSFKIKDLGLARECLGMRIERDSETPEIRLSQKTYIQKILEKYGMQDCKPVGTPVETNLRLDRGLINDNPRYQEIIGSLMYLACCTRPDISYAVTMLSQFNTCNDSTHMAAVKRVLRYLKGTMDLSLCYKKCNKALCAYADSDWGNGPDGKSFSGYTLIFGGAAIAWQSKKQRCVALSTAEAEYIAICEVAKEVVSVNGLYAELTNLGHTVTVYSDSQSASKLVYTPAIGKRSKHVNIRYHFVRELAEQRVISVKYCETALMPADMFTKGVTRLKHEFCAKHCGLSGDVVKPS